MKFVHTNLISADWKKLAGFYIQVFECKLVLPQRDLSGDWLSKGTAVKEAHLKGAHLRLPGYGKSGPTLEIFEYSKMEEQSTPLSNRKGFGHIAFEVNDVQAVLDKALQFGGTAYGEIAKKTIDDVGTLTFVYIKDPEGNIIELQNWGELTAKANLSDKMDSSNELPKDEDKTLVVKGEEKENFVEKEEHIESFSDKVGKDELKTKRELLDELNNDLNTSKREILDSKNNIKLSKEEAKLSTPDEKPLTYVQKQEEEAKQKAAHKAQLLADLKKEMGLADDNKISLNTNNNTPKENDKPVQKVIVPQPKVPAKLTVEIKTATNVMVFDLSGLALSISTEKIAKDLRSLTTLARPDDYESLFIEWICKDYRADVVPLLQQYRQGNSPEKNNEAWAILPRLRDSLQHLLGKCESEPEVLVNQRLDSIGMTAKDVVTAYQNLLTIVLEAEKNEASHLRLNYSDRI